MPSAIEYEKGVTIIQINAGIASVGSLKLIWPTLQSIKNPTIINAGAVAADGTKRKRGLKNNEAKN